MPEDSVRIGRSSGDATKSPSKSSSDSGDFTLYGFLADNAKFSALLLPIILFVQSDAFQDSILGSIKGAVDIEGATLWGETVKALILVFLVLLLKLGQRFDFI